MEIRTKIIERSGYDEVFTVDGDNYNSAEYNSIKGCYSNKDVSMSSIALITDTHYGGRKGSKKLP